MLLLFAVGTGSAEEGLDQYEGKLLLRMARDTLVKFLHHQTVPKISSYPVTGRMREKRGVFVTLRDRTSYELRGCIGYIASFTELPEAVINCTIYAATRDLRFTPLRAGEEENVVIEVSVLSPPQPIKTLDQIQVGIHGLVLTNGTKTGVLLPHVAIEQHWSRDEFLKAICRKADLPERAWEHGAQLYTFTAQTFSEKIAASR